MSNKIHVKVVKSDMLLVMANVKIISNGRREMTPYKKQYATIDLVERSSSEAVLSYAWAATTKKNNDYEISRFFVSKN